MTKMEEEIKHEFTKNQFLLDDEEDIIQKCLAFCINYKLSAPDIVSSWEVYSLNRGLEFTVSNAHMGAFLEQLQSEQLNKVREREIGLHLYSNDIAIEYGEEDMKEVMLHSPANRATSSIESPSDPARTTNGSRFTSGRALESVTPFGQRKNKFAIQFTLNEAPTVHTIKVEDNLADSEDDIIKKVQPIQKFSFLITSSQLKPGCKFMYDRIEDKFNFLENRIKNQALSYVSSGEYEEPVDPSVASQKSIFAVGLICCEEEGHLKDKPVMLQSSVDHSGGQLVRLDLQNLNQFSIFPGQVVGVEGINPSGHCLIASRIFDCAPMSVSSSDQHPAKRQAMDLNLQLKDSPIDVPELSLIVAAGPFTTSDNLFFEPLTELLAYARRKQPQLLVLLGPFIDSDHPEIKKGYVNWTFDEMFYHEILGKLQDYAEYMGSSARVILMPSVRDANHDFVFPQAPLDIQSSGFSHQIQSISNPGTFCANEVKLACCNVDVLKHLSAEEISRNPQGGSKQRLTNLAKHIIKQNSFYPLYPPAEDVPLDYSLSREALCFSSIPDILILPSDLAHFAKVVSFGENCGEEGQIKCICVNPGRLARGEGGGFFAEIGYKGNPDSSSVSIIRI